MDSYRPWAALLGAFFVVFLVLVLTAPSEAFFMLRTHCYRGITWMVVTASLADFIQAAVYLVGIPGAMLTAIRNGGGWRGGVNVPRTVVLWWLGFIWLCGASHLAETLEAWVDVAVAVVALKLASALTGGLAVVATGRRLHLFSLMWSMLVGAADTHRRQP